MDTDTQAQFIKCAHCGATNRLRLCLPDKEPVCGRCKKPLVTTTQPLIVSDASFASLVEQSPLPVLIDLWAPWCGPCRMMAPVIDQLAVELAGKVRVAKLNTDENPMIGRRFGIQSIPTLLILKNGREVSRLIGAQPKAIIMQKLREII